MKGRREAGKKARKKVKEKSEESKKEESKRRQVGWGCSSVQDPGPSHH